MSDTDLGDHAPARSHALSDYYPLSLLPKEAEQQLSSLAEQEEYSAGNTVLKPQTISESTWHYLVSGKIEHRVSFNDRRVYDCSDESTRNPLEELLEEGGSIRAIEDVTLLSIPKDSYDELMANSQDCEFEVISMEDYQVLDDAIIDDSYEEDWSHNFLSSPLACQLDASTLQTLFAKLEPVEFDEDEEIIRCHSPGDYFYILQSGEAEILTEADGPFGGATIELLPGQYFGDEALVSDTKRNACVHMKQSGVVGRLSAEDFEELIKRQLVQTTASTDGQELDVRLALEYRHDGHPGSQNIPITQVRNKLATFDAQQTYLINSNGGRRADLAVYLMKQAGLSVYLTPDTQAEPQDAGSRPH